MSLRVMTWAWHIALPPAAKLVLMALADEADDAGYCFPSQRRLALKASIGERTVRRILAELEARALLHVERRYRPDRSQTSNGYRLTCGDPPAKLTRGEGLDDQGPRVPMTRGVVTVGRLPTTYPLSNPTPQPPEPERRDAEGSHDATLGGGGELEFPTSLSAGERKAMRAVLQGLSPAVAQVVLDELAGRLRVARVTNPVRYTATLAARARRGTFAPELGIRVTEERASRCASAAQHAVVSHGGASQNDDVGRHLPEAIRTQIERMRNRGSMTNGATEDPQTASYEDAHRSKN